MSRKTEKYLQAGLVIGDAGVAAYFFPPLIPTIKIAAFGAASKIINS